MLKWINKKRNKKGFTLIELIVVIAILGILAALAIPRLSGSRDRAEQKSILANLRTIESAIAIWDAENTDPAVAGADGNLVTDDKGTLKAWPSGPKTIEYGINTSNEAIVTAGAAGGSEATALKDKTLADLLELWEDE